MAHSQVRLSPNEVTAVCYLEWNFPFLAPPTLVIYPLPCFGGKTNSQSKNKAGTGARKGLELGSWLALLRAPPVGPSRRRRPLRSTHLQALGPRGEGGHAAGQDRAPEGGFALLVLIRAQPAWLVLLPCGERPVGGGEEWSEPRASRAVAGSPPDRGSWPSV